MNTIQNQNLDIDLLKKGAEIHHSVKCDLLNYLNDSFKENNQENLKLINITKFIETKIRTGTKYSDSSPLKAGIAFPVGLNINDVVAHWSPNPSDTSQCLTKNDIIKIDYGVHFDGNIIDSAFSYSYSDKFTELIKISEEATNKGCEMINPGVLINDISEAIQEIIESSEIEIDKKTYQVKSIQNLTGHQIEKYKIHGGKMIPNVVIPYYRERIDDNELYAIETYPSTGKGVGTLYNSSDGISHYMLNYDFRNIIPSSINLTSDEKALLATIKKKFGTLPFSRRWLSSLKIKRYLITLFKLVNKQVIAEYPPYYEVKGSYVAQTEKNVIFVDGKKTILT